MSSQCFFRYCPLFQDQIRLLPLLIHYLNLLLHYPIFFPRKSNDFPLSPPLLVHYSTNNISEQVNCTYCYKLEQVLLTVCQENLMIIWTFSSRVTLCLIYRLPCICDHYQTIQTQNTRSLNKYTTQYIHYCIIKLYC